MQIRKDEIERIEGAEKITKRVREIGGQIGIDVDTNWVSGQPKKLRERHRLAVSSEGNTEEIELSDEEVTDYAGEGSSKTDNKLWTVIQRLASRPRSSG